MKKIVAYILIIVSLMSFTGCNNGQSLARTPEEEYARIQSIDGEDTIFNFSTLQKLQINQSVDISSAEILENNSNKPVVNTLIFQYDATKPENIKSYAKIDRLISIFLANPSGSDKISYTSIVYSFRDNTSQLGGYFPSYLSYAQVDPSAPDSYFRSSIKLLKDEHLTGFDGRRLFGTYTTTAQVKEGSTDEFLEWFHSFFRFIPLKTEAGLYSYFKPETVKNIKFEMKTSAVQLLELSVSFEADGQHETIAGNSLTITAKSEFKKSGFKVTEPERTLI